MPWAGSTRLRARRRRSRRRTTPRASCRRRLGTTLQRRAAAAAARGARKMAATKQGARPRVRKKIRRHATKMKSWTLNEKLIALLRDMLDGVVLTASSDGGEDPMDLAEPIVYNTIACLEDKRIQ